MAWYYWLLIAVILWIIGGLAFAWWVDRDTARELRNMKPSNRKYGESHYLDN
jgi:hypothetical protein